MHFKLHCFVLNTEINLRCVKLKKSLSACLSVSFSYLSIFSTILHRLQSHLACVLLHTQRKVQFWICYNLTRWCCFNNKILVWNFEQKTQKTYFRRAMSAIIYFSQFSTIMNFGLICYLPPECFVPLQLHLMDVYHSQISQ